MKTLELTDDEANWVVELVEDHRKDWDEALVEDGGMETLEREEGIREVRTAEAVLKKLGPS